MSVRIFLFRHQTNPLLFRQKSRSSLDFADRECLPSILQNKVAVRRVSASLARDYHTNSRISYQDSKPWNSESSRRSVYRHNSASLFYFPPAVPLVPFEAQAFLQSGDATYLARRRE